MGLRAMASRGQSFSLGNPWASTALVMLKYAGQILQRPHFAYSLTALTADSATTHSVVQSLHASAPVSPRRLLTHLGASPCQTTCPWAFWTRKKAPPPSVASTLPRTTWCNRSRLVTGSLIRSPVQEQRWRGCPCRRRNPTPAHPPPRSCSCSSGRTGPTRLRLAGSR